MTCQNKNYLIVILFFILIPFHSFASGKIYGKSKTLSKDYIKYEKCSLRKTEENVKDGDKDGYKCIYKRQLKGKDVTIFQPSSACLKSFKCKREIQ
jgi:hypothetical protein|tara:strand:- start:128 stop:415 length:288 start_codon:yes stop_codon:yes gene_type:complete